MLLLLLLLQPVLGTSREREFAFFANLARESLERSISVSAMDWRHRTARWRPSPSRRSNGSTRTRRWVTSSGRRSYWTVCVTRTSWRSTACRSMEVLWCCCSSIWRTETSTTIYGEWIWNKIAYWLKENLKKWLIWRESGNLVTESESGNLLIKRELIDSKWIS